MADLASLRIAVDSRSVDTAAADLDELAVSANRAEGATDRLAGTARTTSTAMSGMSNAVRQAQAAQAAAAAAVSGLGGSARLSASQMTNLSYQVQDLGVQLASGTPPMMAFIQQGSQIAGMMQASGMGVMGFTKAVIASTGAALGAMVVNPVFLAIAGSAAVVSAAVNFMADDISEASGTTVTAGDVMLGTFDVLSNYVSDTVAAAFAYFGTTTGEVWDAVVGYTRNAVNIIIGIVSLIPRAFSKAFEVVPTIIDQLMSGDISGALDTAGSAMSTVVTDSFRRDFIGEFASVVRDAAINRANIRAAEEAGKATGRAAARAVADAVDKELMSLGQRKQNTINKLKAEAATVAALAEQYDRATAALEDNIRRGELELELQNLRAQGHEEVARMMEINYREEQALAELRANEAGYSIEQLAELERLTREWFDLQRGAAQQESFLARQNEQAELLKKQGLEILAIFERIAGTNGAIADFGRAFKDLFPKEFKAIGGEFKKIAERFGIDLGAALAGAKMGEAFAGISKAVGLPSSKTGGQIGGTIGGAFFGPLGAAIGSAVGSLGVGLAKGVKKASATIEVLASDQVQQTVKGNKALQDAATGMANSLIDGLKQIADALGGSLLEGVKISIGQRGNTFRVDPLGLGRTKGMEKFKTEEEAIAYAMKLALEKGVIKGISESAQRLLAAGNDLQDAIEKAVLFEGVFDRLKEKLDPVGYSLEKLDKEFAKLRAVFKEAGASAAEYASLEQLYALERAAVLKDANKEQIDELQQTVDSMKDLSDSLREFRDSLFRANSGVVNYQSALVDLIRVGALAASGDAAALGQLQGVSETFLGASRSRARSLFEYQRDVALVANYVDQGIAAADAQVSAAQQQIDLLGSQLDQLEQINAKMSVAIGAPAVASGSPSMIFDANQSGSSVLTGSTDQQLSAINATLSDGLYTIAKNTGGTYKVLDQWDGDGQPDIRELSSDYY